MKNLKLILLLQALMLGAVPSLIADDDCPCDGGTSAYTVSCGEGDPDACDTSECATVSSLSAEDEGNSGSRSSTSSLVMVNNGSRTATITGSTSGTLGDGYPKWSGTGVSGNDGEMTATFSGTSDSTVTFEASPYSSETIDIDIQMENAVSVSLSSDDDWATSVEATIQGFLNFLVKDSSGDSFSLSGSINGSQKDVDLYNDGSSTGMYHKFGGSITGDFAAAKFKGPPLPVAGGLVTVRALASFTAASAKVSVNFTHDESKQDQWVGLSGGLTFNQNASIGAEAVVGSICFITYTASMPLSLGGTLSHDNSCVNITPFGSAGPVDGTLKVTVEVTFPKFECTLYEKQHALYDDSISVGGSPFCIYTFDS